MKISIIGAGVVGCATAVGFSNRGHNVHLVECNPDKITSIREGKWKSSEPKLGSSIAPLIEQGQLKLSREFDKNHKSEIVFICVGTPSSQNGYCELSFLLKAAKEIINKGHSTFNPLIVVRSTTPPGTITGTIKPYLEEMSPTNTTKSIRIASNPEFLREGSALSDFLNPERIVIGIDNQKDAQLLRRIYSDFGAPVIEVSIPTAEMIKSASNAFLATKISFINEIGILCKQLGIDTYEVAKGLGYDRRIGPQYLEAGLGFGGSCIPKDLRALIHLYGEEGITSLLLNSVQEVNKNQIQILEKMILEKYGPLKKKQITILGLSFKPNTDTIIESPALLLIEMLLNQRAIITVHDPEAIQNAQNILDRQVKYSSSVSDAVRTADFVVITTGWDEYSDSELFRGKHVIDTRRIIRGREIPDGTYTGFLW